MAKDQNNKVPIKDFPASAPIGWIHNQPTTKQQLYTDSRRPSRATAEAVGRFPMQSPVVHPVVE